MPREEFKSPRDVPLARHKFINSPETCVQDSLEGFVAVNPGVRLLRQCGAVVRHDFEQLGGKVTLVAGGGSGHEPGFSGFIGEGLLTAAVAGPIYTSPFSDNILATLRTVGANNKAGVLTFVCNYTGDRLTFGIAIEKARAEGIQVDMVLIAEDTALPHTFPSTGRRGLCGAVFMMKVAGAMADEMKSLEEIKTFIEERKKDMGTITVALTPCSIPGKEELLFNLPRDKMELGMGVHGEAGTARVPILTASETAQLLMDHLRCATSDHSLPLKKVDLLRARFPRIVSTSKEIMTPNSGQPPPSMSDGGNQTNGCRRRFSSEEEERERNERQCAQQRKWFRNHREAAIAYSSTASSASDTFAKKEQIARLESHRREQKLQLRCSPLFTKMEKLKGDHVAVMLNNLGGLTTLEMNILAKEIIGYLESMGVCVVRAYSGFYMTSLESAGISVSVLKVDALLLRYLDASTNAPAWTKPYCPVGFERFTPADVPAVVPKKDDEHSLGEADQACVLGPEEQEKFRLAMVRACESLLVHEKELNKLDSECGDGDCGTTLASGAQGILAYLDSRPSLAYPGLVMAQLSHVASSSMGGTSGALYSLLFHGAAKSFTVLSGYDAWVAALEHGIKLVMKYSMAQVGDRTMLDTLNAALMELQKDHGRLDSVGVQRNLNEALKAMSAAVALTLSMKPRAGRATYVNPDLLKHVDPGARAVEVWLGRAIRSVITPSP